MSKKIKISRKRLFEDDNVHMNKNKNNVSSYITEDLIVEILLRLPPLSVLRFQRVCKQWYTLISNPDFLRTHSSPSSPFQLLHTNNNNSTTSPHEHHDHQFLVFTKPVVEYVPLTQFEEEHRKPPPSSLLKQLRLYLPPGGYEFIDACNGLFLFQHRRKRVANIAGTYYIYNPITKYYFKLPDIMTTVKTTEGHLFFSKHANLVFEPIISLTYKVIRVLRNSYRRHRVYWQIYSSETGSWRLLSTIFSPPKYTIQFGFGSVLLNGVLYWLYSTTRRDVSVNFDVVKECVCFLTLPPNPEHSFRSCLYLGKCGGRLRLIERFLEVAGNPWEDSPDNLPCSFDIMEMEPKNQQQQEGVHCTWNVKYRVNIGSVYDLLNKRNASVVHCYQTKSRQENEEEQEVLLLRLSYRSIVSFNLTSKKFINEIVFSESPKVCDFKNTFAYTPTLYPLS